MTAGLPALAAAPAAEKPNIILIKTVILFADNGTAKFGAELATVEGKKISGMKATMLEGGRHVPLVVNWPGTTPAGKGNKDLVDFSDFFSTFAQLGGAPLPEEK